MANSNGGSSEKNGQLHQSVYPSKDSMTDKTKVPSSSRLAPPRDPMSLLTSPARGLDSAITSSMLDPDCGANEGPVKLTILLQIAEVVERSGSCIYLVAEPRPTPMPGTPPIYAEYFKKSPEISSLPQGLEKILLSVRRLREVYEISVILSILCGDKAQLTSSISRLVQEIYPVVSEDSLKKAQASFVSQDIHALFPGENCPSALWEKNSAAVGLLSYRLALFQGVWLLESICSNRTGNAQEYLLRRAFLKEHEQSPSRDLSLDFCHKVFLAIQRKQPKNLHYAMTAQLHDITSCSPAIRGGTSILFWLRAMAQQLLPMARAQSGRIIRHAYLRVSVLPEFYSILTNNAQELQSIDSVPGNSESVCYFELMLLLQPKLQQWTCAHSKPHSPSTTHEIRNYKSLIVLMILASLFGKKTWSEALPFLQTRLVAHEGSYAVNLKP